MKRIDLDDHLLDLSLCRIAAGVNEIMDFLEKNVPVRNGKLFHCLNCGHNTGYPGDLDCCDTPSWQIIG